MPTDNLVLNETLPAVEARTHLNAAERRFPLTRICWLVTEVTLLALSAYGFLAGLNLIFNGDSDGWDSVLGYFMIILSVPLLVSSAIVLAFVWWKPVWGATLGALQWTGIAGLALFVGREAALSFKLCVLGVLLMWLALSATSRSWPRSMSRPKSAVGARPPTP